MGVIERIEDVVEPLPQLVLAVPAFVDALPYDKVSNLLIKIGMGGVRKIAPVEAKTVLLKQSALSGVEPRIKRVQTAALFYSSSYYHQAAIAFSGKSFSSIILSMRRQA